MNVIHCLLAHRRYPEVTPRHALYRQRALLDGDSLVAVCRFILALVTTRYAT